MSSKTTTKPVSKTEWGKLATHEITCPSGAVVKVKIPNLAMLLAGDALPETLKGAALRELAGGITAGPAGIDADLISGLVDLHHWLVTQTVVDPKLEVADLDALPQEDLDMLVQIATRERDVDALGVRLGVEPLNRWDTFRRFHGCDESCEACHKSRAALSTAHVG